MNNELNLSAVLAHSVIFFSKETHDAQYPTIAFDYAQNCGAGPADRTQESMDTVLKAYASNLPQLIKSQADAARQYEPEMQKLRAEISPKDQQLNADLYSQFGPQFAKTGSDIARQNAEEQAKTDLGVVSGTGRDLVREAMKTQREADPEAYRARALALQNLEQLQGSLTDPNAGLSGAERAEVDRSLARENYARGTGATPTATSTVSNAMAFGGAGEARKAQRQSAIANAAQLATGAVQPLSSRIDTFQLTTGRPSANFGEQRAGGASQVGQESNAMGMGLFNSANAMRQQENQINAGRQSGIDQVLAWSKAASNLGSAAGGAGCCWTFAEAYYGWENIPDAVKVSRDMHYTPQIREGYRMMSRWVIPKMQQSDLWRAVVNAILIKPMTSHAEWYVNGKGLGWMFSPLQKTYLALWEYYGERAGVPAEVFNLRLAAGPWNSGIYPR